MKKNLIHVGTFCKSIGLKGEVTIINHTPDYTTFKSIDAYLNYNGDSVWDFKYLIMRNNRLVGLLSGYENRNLSESLKGIKIFADKNKIDNQLKIFFQNLNLVNFKVFDSKNNLLGYVDSIENFGAGDLINLKKLNNQTIYIPINQENVVKINKNRKNIIAKPIKGILD